MYKNLFLILFNIALVLILLVIFSNYVLREYRTSINLRVDGDWVIESDTAVGFVRAKNAASHRKHLNTEIAYNIYSDDRGGRVNIAGEPSPASVDIMTIGGSFSEGHGIENEETFTSIVGREFDVPVANFALGSYGTVQSLQMLERNSDLNPKVIIYGFITDHLRRNLSPCAPTYGPSCLGISYVGFDKQGQPCIYPPQTEYSQELLHDFLEEVVWDSPYGLNDIKWAARVTLKRFEDKTKFSYSDDTEKREKSMYFLLNRLAEEAKRINAKLVVVHIPYLDRQNTNPPPPELLKALTPDFIFIDFSTEIANYYRDAHNPTLVLHETDSHPNRIAHELFARKIHAVLLEKNIL